MSAERGRCCVASSIEGKTNVKGDDCCIREIAQKWKWDWIEPSKADVNKTKNLQKSKPSKGKTRSRPVSQFQEEYWNGVLRGVKVFKRGPGADMDFVKEVGVLDKIGTHKHIVKILGLSKPKEDDGYAYWMDKMETDLYKFLSKDLSGGNSQPFSVTHAKVVLLQIAKAMKHLHEKDVIHGDLKSANILVNPSVQPGVDPTVRVADFGNATFKKLGNGKVKILGTVEYAAPEVVKELLNHSGGAEVSVPNAKECDVYSFGIVAIEVLEDPRLRQKRKKSLDILKLSEIQKRSEAIKESVETILKSGKYLVDLVNLVARCLDLEPSPLHPHSFKYVSEGSGPSRRPPFAEVTTKLE